jgi:Fe-S-cluster-containing hydrogenase component 2
MKVLSVKAERCTGCHLCEETCAETWFKVKDRAKSAIHIGERPKADAPYSIIVCTQCGECIDICPTKAIRRAANGVVRIDKAKCVGCMACVGFCTIWAMRMHADDLAPFKCVACGKCVKVCPEGVLSIEEEAAPKVSETEKWAERVAA